MKRYLSFVLCILFSLCTSQAALAVDGIQIAEPAADYEGGSIAYTDSSFVIERSDNRFTLSGGLGAVFLPVATFQAEIQARPRSSVVLGVQAIYGGFYIIGTANMGYRMYITGDAHGGIFVQGGVHGGAGVAFYGQVMGVGPQAVVGGKYEARNGFTVDVGLGMSAIADIAQTTDYAIVPVPTVQIGLGRRLKKRR